MAVKHTFVNGHADGGDATQTQPSNWNANHTIDNATITLAMLANVSATQRVLGRNTAGAGVPEEVTASQLFDWVSNTNGVLLTRTGGTWGAAANVSIDNGDLQVAVNAAPVTPAASVVKHTAALVGGRGMPAWVDQNGRIGIPQPHVGRVHPCWWMPRPNAAGGPDFMGSATPTVAGTGTARALAATSLATSLRRLGLVSAAGAASVSGVRNTVASFYRGDAGDNGQRGGFHLSMVFMISDAVLVGTANMFCGLQAATGVPTDVDPATLTNLLGIGCTSGDTVMQLYAAGAAAQAKASLGANFPVNTITTDVYRLELYCPPAGADVRYLVTRLNTGHQASGTISAGANLPSSTTFLTQQMWRSNGGTAAAVGLDFISLYMDSEV